VRAGFVARAITYGLMGGIALALAVGAGSRSAHPSQQGALALIASVPLGRVAVAAIAAGLLAYALWKFAQGILGRGPEGGLVYAVFFAVAIEVFSGSSGGDAADTKHAAAGVLGWPGGSIIVAVAGAGLMVISAYQIVDALRGSFADDSKVGQMGAIELRIFLALGLIGLIARGLVFGLVGYFLLRTAIEYNPAHALGVDGALAQVHREPYGPTLLGFVAAGLLTFAAFSLLEGRHRRL